jgi:hypothetical protein
MRSFAHNILPYHIFSSPTTWRYACSAAAQTAATSLFLATIITFILYHTLFSMLPTNAVAFLLQNPGVFCEPHAPPTNVALAPLHSPVCDSNPDVTPLSPPVTVIPVWAAAGFTCSRLFSPTAAAAATAATAAIGILMFSTMPELAYRRSGEVCAVFVTNVTTDILN